MLKALRCYQSPMPDVTSHVHGHATGKPSPDRLPDDLWLQCHLSMHQTGHQPIHLHSCDLENCLLRQRPRSSRSKRAVDLHSEVANDAQGQSCSHSIVALSDCERLMSSYQCIYTFYKPSMLFYCRAHAYPNPIFSSRHMHLSRPAYRVSTCIPEKKECSQTALE